MILKVSLYLLDLYFGSIPNVLKEIKNKEIVVNNKKEIKHKKRKENIINMIFLIIAFIIGISLVILENKISTYISMNVNSIYLFISGFIMAIGIIVPGVSSTIILMIFGVYNIYIDSVSIVNLQILIPMGLGVSLGSIVWMKITKILIDKYYKKTFYAIIGFTLGSIFVLFPKINNIYDLILMILFSLIAFSFIKLIEK